MRHLALTWTVRLPRLVFNLLIGAIVTNWLAILPTFAADTWVSIGPAGDFGSATQPNVNGRIRSIDIQSIPGDYYVYVGASSGGVWRTRGSTGPVWTSLGDNLPNPAVGAFAVHPSNPDDILVGTGDYARYVGAGMFHTSNAGQTWTKINNLPVNPNYFFRIFYIPGNPNVLLAASDSGLLRSTNGLAGPWLVVLDGIVSDLVLHPSNPNVQYAARATLNGQGGGVYKSDDAGETWEFITPFGAPFNAFGIARIAVSREFPDTVAFVFEWGCNIKGIRKSTDGGITWTLIDGSLYNAGNSQACHALSIAIRPNDPAEIYVGANKIWKTVNGGQEWEKDPLPDSIDFHQDHLQLYFSSITGENVLWICSDGGVYRYQVGQNFASSWNGDNQTGLRVAQISDMDAKRDFRVAGLQDDGAVASNDGGTNWTGYECCDVFNVAITEDLNPTFWHNVFQAQNMLKRPFSGAAQDVSDPTQKFIDNASGHIFCDRFCNTVYTLRADGMAIVSRPATAAMPGSWTTEINFSNAVTTIRGSYLNGTALYVWGTPSGTGVLTVLRKTGGNWNVQRTPTIGGLVNPLSVQTVFVSTEQQSESWVGLSNRGGTESPGGTAKILHTTDDWQTWTELSRLPSEAGQVTAIVVTPFNSKQIFVATDVGVYWTQDGGATWEAFQTGLPRVYCTGLRYVIDHTFNGNDKLVVSTFGRGMYERLIPRPPLVYVDPQYTGVENGTFEHPYNTLVEGISNTPNSGMLALRGAVYSVPFPLNKPLIINAYESPVELSQ